MFGRALLAAAALALGARAEDGWKRIEIDLPAGAPAPDAMAVAKALGVTEEGGPGKRGLRVMVKKVDGATRLQLDILGVAVGADAADKLRAAFPGLKDARIAVGDVPEGEAPAIKVEGTSDPAEIKRQIEEKLAAEGKTADVDVEVDESQGKKRIKVKVEAVDEE